MLNLSTTRTLHSTLSDFWLWRNTSLSIPGQLSTFQPNLYQIIFNSLFPTSVFKTMVIFSFCYLKFMNHFLLLSNHESLFWVRSAREQLSCAWHCVTPHRQSLYTVSCTLYCALQVANQCHEVMNTCSLRPQPRILLIENDQQDKPCPGINLDLTFGDSGLTQ